MTTYLSNGKLNFFHSISLGEVCNGRDNNFNLLRVCAALAVIVSHSFILSGNEPNQLPRILGFFAVNCFFIISGFLVCRSLLIRQDLLQFMWARALRIYPALITAVLFCVFVIGPIHTSITLREYFLSGSTWDFFFHNSTLIGAVQYYLPGVFSDLPGENKVNAPLWTLFYEIYMYLGLATLAFLIRPFTTFNRFSFFRYTLLVTAIVCFAGFILMVDTKLPREPYGNLFRFGYFFAMGACLYLFRDKITLSPKILAVMLVLIAISASNRILFNATTYLFLGYILLYLAYVPKGWLLSYNRLGDYSYGLYIFAYPIQQSIVAWWPKSSTSAVFFGCLTVTIVIAAFSWHLLEQYALSKKNAIRSRKLA